MKLFIYERFELACKHETDLIFLGRGPLSVWICIAVKILWIVSQILSMYLCWFGLKMDGLWITNFSCCFFLIFNYFHFQEKNKKTLRLGIRFDSTPWMNCNTILVFITMCMCKSSAVWVFHFFSFKICMFIPFKSSYW